jgi:hypothetical protein
MVERREEEGLETETQDRAEERGRRENRLLQLRDWGGVGGRWEGSHYLGTNPHRVPRTVSAHQHQHHQHPRGQDPKYKVPKQHHAATPQYDALYWIWGHKREAGAAPGPIRREYVLLRNCATILY